MALSRSDVGKKMVAGVQVELSDAEKDAMVLRWNANAVARAKLPEPEVINMADIITEMELVSETKGRFDALRVSRRED
tara:strand:+ start:902 stop:1135 length:234 start_codon:yes stop_codon:yes gene_type:complete